MLFNCQWIDADGTKALVLTREQIAKILFNWKMKSTSSKGLFASTIYEQESLLWIGPVVPNWDNL